LIMVQRDGEKQSRMTSGGRTLIGIHFECWKQTTIAKIAFGNLAINWRLLIIYSWRKRKLNYCIQLDKRDVIKKWLTPRTINGGMSHLLAWWQIPHSLALLGHKCNNYGGSGLCLSQYKKYEAEQRHGEGQAEGQAPKKLNSTESHQQMVLKA
jgi:hypothetical protein